MYLNTLIILVLVENPLPQVTLHGDQSVQGVIMQSMASGEPSASSSSVRFLENINDLSIAEKSTIRTD
jgi:hypothetical protein